MAFHIFRAGKKSPEERVYESLFSRRPKFYKILLQSMNVRCILPTLVLGKTLMPYVQTHSHLIQV